MNSSSPIRFSIPDLQTGTEILSRLPLAHSAQACVDLNGFLDSLQAIPPDPQTYFRLLEHARVTSAHILEEQAKRYLNKPLPFGDIEDEIFQMVVATWQKIAKAYAHCAQLDVPEDTPEHARLVATLLQRCIFYTGSAILEHLRARREYPWGLWHDLHGYFGSAEEWGLANLGVPDTLDSPGLMTHCTATYVGFLLCDIAGCYSLSLKDQALIRSWATLWSPLVSVHPVTPDFPPTGFVIDLTQDCALRPASQFLPGENMRSLDTSRLTTQLAHIREQLRQRIPPAQLSLGEDCTAGQCTRLIEHLMLPWSLAPIPRKFRRRPSAGNMRLCAGFDEMYYFIRGKVFEQPENVRIYSRREFETLFAFRHQENPQQVLQLQKEQINFRIDEWEIVNESAQGFRLMRSLSGRKMRHGQLIALCPPDAAQLFLARTFWLMQERDGGLTAGGDALPGIPQPIAARIIEQDGRSPEKFRPAFLLPADSAVGTDASLVLPLGLYRNSRIVEIFTDTSWQVRLLQVLDEGPDFERVAFGIC